MSAAQQSPVAEIVSFALNDGVSDAEFVALSQTSQAYVSYAKGFVSRTLSKGSDGRWTDYVVWNSLEDAQAAQAGFMAQDFAPALVGAIDPDSLSMTHQQVLWSPH